MACRIVLSGAGSVGKTTLATDWIKRHKEYAHISEVARDVMKQHSLTRDDLIESLKTPEKATFLHLQKLIFEEQNRREISLGSNPFISDRGPDPLAYVCLKKSAEAADELAKTPAASECLERYQKSLVLVLCPLATPSDDGFRMVQDREEQKQFTRVLCEQLQKHGIPYIYVDETDRRKRIAVVERAVQGMLHTKLTCMLGFEHE
jgi:nicotinamide riboside kinase